MTRMLRDGVLIWVHHQGQTFSVPAQQRPVSSATAGAVAGADGILKAPMPAGVLLVNCKVGDKVKKGASLCVLEAMKMEYHLTAPFDGIVHAVHCRVGERVALGAKLIEVEA